MKKSNFSLYGLPSKVKFCKKCIISNQRPNSVVEFKNTSDLKSGIKFDKNVCDACHYNQIKNDIRNNGRPSLRRACNIC